MATGVLSQLLNPTPMGGMGLQPSGGSPMGLLAPRALPAPTGPQGILADFMSQLRGMAQNNPQALMGLGAGLMQGKPGAGFAMAGDAMGEYRKQMAGKQDEQRRRRQAAQFLARSNPELADFVRAGMDPADAFKLAADERKGGKDLDPYGFPTSGAISQKMRALKLQGFDDQTALGLASGRYSVSLDPMSGNRVIVDMATQQVVPLGMSGGMGAPGAMQQPGAGQMAQGGSLYEMADEGTGVGPSIKSGLSDTLGQVPGPIGRMATFPETTEAVQNFELFKRDLIRSLSLNPRFPVAEQQRIENLVPRGALTSPETLRTSLVVLDQELSRIEREAAAGLADPTTTVTQRQADQQTIRSVRAARERLGVPQGGTGSGAPGAPPPPPSWQRQPTQFQQTPTVDQSGNPVPAPAPTDSNMRRTSNGLQWRID